MAWTLSSLKCWAPPGGDDVDFVAGAAADDGLADGRFDGKAALRVAGLAGAD